MLYIYIYIYILEGPGEEKLMLIGLASLNKEFELNWIESSIFNGLKVMAKVKVLVHAANADADSDGRAMTLAPRTFVLVR